MNDGVALDGDEEVEALGREHPELLKYLRAMTKLYDTQREVAEAWDAMNAGDKAMIKYLNTTGTR